MTCHYCVGAMPVPYSWRFPSFINSRVVWCEPGCRGAGGSRGEGKLPRDTHAVWNTGAELRKRESTRGPLMRGITGHEVPAFLQFPIRRSTARGKFKGKLGTSDFHWPVRTKTFLIISLLHKLPLRYYGRLHLLSVRNRVLYIRA